MYEFNKTTNFLKEKMNQEQNFKPNCENMEIGDIQDIQDIQEMEIGDDQRYIQEEDEEEVQEEEEDEEVVEGLEFCGTFIRREQIDEMKQFFEDEITKELLAPARSVYDRKIRFYNSSFISH